MGRDSRFGRAALGLVAAAVAFSCAPEEAGPPPELGLLQQDAQQLAQIVNNPFTSTPSFIRGAVPVEVMGIVGVDTTDAVGFAFVERYAGLLGLGDARQDLQYVGQAVDGLGMRHMAYRQVVQSVEVYGAQVTVHVSADGSQVTAVSNSAVPDVAVASTTPSIDAAAALATAQDSMPAGVEVSSALAIYPGPRRVPSARLAWFVELRDDAAPARKVYVIDAESGETLDVLDRLYIARNRETYDANGGTSLPGTLARSEGDPDIGDQDVDDAHNFAGETYDYFFGTHGRDSYDDAGATLISTAHYSQNYQNAFWDGRQMVYGDGFPVKDVAAHELTHAVTERTANLEYRWQSGALNESFSDIFGAMVDRDDWLMGEDLPIGAIRDLENPGAFGDPANTSEWVATCNDNEGVHTNSGIHNRAFVNVANAIGKDRAERIFFRSLTVYLGVQSSFEDARSAAIQSAADLYGAGSAEEQATETGFNDVGIDGSWNPPANDCGGLPLPIPSPDLSLLGLVALALAAMVFVVLRRRAPVAG